MVALWKGLELCLSHDDDVKGCSSGGGSDNDVGKDNTNAGGSAPDLVRATSEDRRVYDCPWTCGRCQPSGPS